MSLILQTDTPGIANSIPLYLDGLIAQGTLILVDYRNPLSNTKQANLITNDVITNMVGIAPNGTWFGAAGSSTFDALNPQLGVVSNNTSTAQCLFGNNFVTSTQDWLAIAWVKMPTTGGANFGVIAGKGTSISANSFWIEGGAAPVNDSTPFAPRFAAAGSGQQTIAGLTLPRGTRTQLAISTNLSLNRATVYRDGVAVGSFTCNNTNSINTSNLQYGPANGSYYRFFLENLTASGRNPATVVAEDWAANQGRFA